MAGRLASAYDFVKECRVGVLGLQPHFVCLPLPALATPQIFVNNETEASLCPLAQAHHSQNLLRKICSLRHHYFFKASPSALLSKNLLRNRDALVPSLVSTSASLRSAECLPTVLIRNVARPQGFIKQGKRLRGSASLDICDVKGRASRSVFPLTTTLSVVSFRRIIPSCHFVARGSCLLTKTASLTAIFLLWVASKGKCALINRLHFTSSLGSRVAKKLEPQFLQFFLLKPHCLIMRIIRPCPCLTPSLALRLHSS